MLNITRSYTAGSTYVLCFFLGVTQALCQQMPVKPLQGTIEKSSVIAVCRLMSYASDAGSSPAPKPAGRLPNGTPYYAGNQAFLLANTLKSPGVYQFKVLQVIKGELGSAVSIHLPTVYLYPYGDYWNFKLDIAAEGTFVLLLQPNGQLYAPEDPALPFIPISPNYSVDRGETTMLQVADLLLPRGSSAAINTADSYLLSTLPAAEMVGKLFPYVNDPNVYVRDNVLACFAINQQVAAIPRIVNLAKLPEFVNYNSHAVAALQSYNLVDAVPYLNPLVSCSDYTVRHNGIYALYKIADTSSIPYLILALRDPDPEHNIPAAAYVALRRLIPALGLYTPQTHDDFVHNFNAQIAPIYTWWDDELLGKHIQQGQKAPILTSLPESISLLNPLLFTPNTADRRKVIAKLSAIADQTSIPYLVLALQDPDTLQTDGNVSYVAYKTLHRLLSLSDHAVSPTAYFNDRSSATESIYDWWQDYLNGKHPATR